MTPKNKHMWGAPIALGMLTAVGLLSGLMGDGIWDTLSAAALAVPVLVAVWYSIKN